MNNIIKLLLSIVTVFSFADTNVRLNYFKSFLNQKNISVKRETANSISVASVNLKPIEIASYFNNAKIVFVRGATIINYETNF
jgi:hypothetical protein